MSSTSLDYMMKLSVWEGGIALAKVQIKVNDNGSFRVTGDVELVDSQGNVFQQNRHFLYAVVVYQKYALLRCFA